MKKIVTFIRDNTLVLIIGIIIGSITVVLADTITSSMVIYDNTTSHSRYTTVQGALDNLYNISDDLYTKVPGSAGLTFIANSVPGLSSTLVAGLYRYQGTTGVNNYICFGTTSQSTCTGNTDAYMYRIIGINESGQMKLIKKEAFNTAYRWHSATGVEWPNSELYKRLNGIDETNTNYFLGTSYVPDGWEARIADVDWHYWTGGNVSMTAANMASAELGAAKVNAKIGLMYAHDYYYGLPGGNNCGYSSYGATCKTSWIFLWQAQNDSSAPNTKLEWLISRGTTSLAWPVYESGALYGSNAERSLAATNSVRPVFYLTSSQVIADGTGTLADPYVLR